MDSGNVIVRSDLPPPISNPSPIAEALKSTRSRYDMADITKFKVDMVYGQGTYGDVFKATEINSGDCVALKRLKMEKETQGIHASSIIYIY